MNKRDLIDAISGRLGDKKSATEAVTIDVPVRKGPETVKIPWTYAYFEIAERPASSTSPSLPRSRIR